MKSALAALGAFLLITTAVSADSPPPVAPAASTTEWAPNEVIEVVAQKPGPAFWHVKKGEAEIFILGTVAPMVKGTTINLDHMSDTIKGARAVYLPPTASAGLLSAGWFLLTHRGLLSMPDGKKLEDTLPPDLKARFVAARTALKFGPEKFDDDPPVLVAAKLPGEFNKVHELVVDGAISNVKDLAKTHRVPVKMIGDYDALDMLKEMLRLPQPAQQKCLADSIAYTEVATPNAKPLSEAWAVGNVKEIKAHFVPHPFEICIQQATSFGKIKDRAVADYLKVIHEALSTPGKVVMVADIGAILRQTGVAEVLHKEGVTIEGPAE
ncbi:uncharacterized protein YbaP (TraB family) [Rhizomicrobium palustre]|uniref:Uncharacterized protein YbaP (TraB family) n=1 Tax=Rhizomicrobium palustre TaxID=189966 RepID=A0A846MXP8_9PROT|nr:TraB/GumN family protein [Rhizomicrobium palustre]NIK87911.1 uncharacterized protein YbaP (TraB family) [Rhizomicrobium palustre]